MLNFIKPSSSPVLVSLVQAGWPFYAKTQLGDLRIEVCEDVLGSFRTTYGQGVVICPNHSAHEDSDVIFGVSRIVGEQFFFLTAREIFGGRYTLRSFFLQKLGCFSVERGLPDIKSFKAARELLVKGKKVVIFPEGEISHQNEFLMQLENGPEHIALAALTELKECQKSGLIYVLPLALKYRYGRDMSSELDAALAKIEGVLGLKNGHSRSLKGRIKNAYDQLLNQLQNMHWSGNSSNETLDLRLLGLREQLILESEAFLRVKLDKSLSQLCRIHILKSMFSTARQHSGTKNDYQLARIFYRQLKLATSLAAVGEHSFNHQLTQEEAAELLNVLEEAIIGKVLLQRPKIVTVGAGELIEVSRYQKIFEKDRKQGVKLLKAELARQVYNRLLTVEELYTKRLVS